MRAAAGLSRAEGRRSCATSPSTWRTASCELDQLAELSDEEVAEQLIAIKGLGPWTVAHVPDLPPRPAGRAAGGRPRDPQGGPESSTGSRALPTPAELERIAEPWRPHRSLASLYLWRSLDNAARLTIGLRSFGGLQAPRAGDRRKAAWAGLSLSASRVETEPAGAVHLRKGLRPARARRPFQLERVAPDRVRVEVALRGPGGDHLAALLPRGAQIGQLARGQRRARLLLELAPRAGLRVLVLAVLALRDRPRARVLAAPRTGPPGWTSSTSARRPSGGRGGCPRCASGRPPPPG